nr:MAG TPA: hypothetical protein [Caudoviricetes sp.]
MLYRYGRSMHLRTNKRGRILPQRRESDTPNCIKFLYCLACPATRERRKKLC